MILTLRTILFERCQSGAVFGIIPQMISNNTKPVNEFSPALWDHLSSTLEKAAAEAKGPRIAAFDADGTLWDSDAGETFFDWQIHNSGLQGLPADPWEYYHSTKKVSPPEAYVWLAQINSGHSITQVREWAQRCFAERAEPWPVFESQRHLIQLLRSLDFEIYIVTASIKWAVEPVAALVGVDFDHVLGITTRVHDGIVTSEGMAPITWRKGKADGLLAATGGVRPILASGNTLGDIAMIDTATHIQLAVSTQDQPCGLFDEEAKLRTEAESRGWLMHKFR
jgi:phosphoserine phosphatase